MRTPIITSLLLLVQIWIGYTLPIVDPGLFVIMGVNTCRAGEGYCLLGQDCTLDEDFLPDDQEGHCDGLKSAFTPSAHFICCKYSAINATDSANSTTSTTAAPFTTSATPQPPGDAMVNILMDYLDTNSEPFVPIKPELMVNHLQPPSEDVELLAEPILLPSEKEEIPVKNVDIIQVSDPVGISNQNNRPIVFKEKVPNDNIESSRPYHHAQGSILDIVNIASSDVMDSQDYIRKAPITSHVGDDVIRPIVFDDMPDIIGTNPPRKGQVTRVSNVPYGDREIQETELVAMIPVEMTNTMKKGQIRRTSGPFGSVGISSVPRLEQINLIPKNYWR